jgi:hypothetical protein
MTKEVLALKRSRVRRFVATSAFLMLCPVTASANSLVSPNLLNSDAIDESDFLIVYDNFTPQQVNQVMVYATRFKGYEQYEVLSQHSSDTQMHYISSIDAPLLSFNFSQTFEDLKWDVITQQVGNQYQFTFVREQPKPLPYGVW